MMNSMYPKLLVPLLLMSVMPPLWPSDVPCNTRLLIENKSGWAITLFYTTIAGGQMEHAMRQGEKLKELDTCLDKIATMSFKRRGQVWGLFATTVSLDRQLQWLQNQLSSHPNKDAVITIGATIKDWQLSSRWEGAVRGSLVMPEDVWQEEELPVVQPTPQAPALVRKPTVQKSRKIVVTLSDVQQGKLGAPYAQKVADIMNTDYAVAEKKGKVNLKNQLIREFSDVTVIRKKDVGEALSSTGIPSEDAKNNIDRLARVLDKYRAAGWVK